VSGSIFTAFYEGPCSKPRSHPWQWQRLAELGLKAGRKLSYIATVQGQWKSAGRAKRPTLGFSPQAR